MTPALVASRLRVSVRGRLRPVLQDASLELYPGEVVGIRGRSGSGKSVLLHTVAGLVPWALGGEVRGELRLGGENLGDLDPTQRAYHLATCLDRPEAQLFLPTVASEWMAATRQHRPDPELARLVASALGIDRLRDRPIVELSSGERQRVALATVLVAAPRPVLLDEPTSHLDPDGQAGLVEALVAVKAASGCALVAEHAGWRLAAAVDRWLELRDGRLREAPPPSEPRLAPPPSSGDGRPVLALASASLQRGGRHLLDRAELRVAAGEVVHVEGSNGVGKSSLARALAGHGLSAGARFHPGSPALWQPEDVALLLPYPDLQLFATTVLAEVRLAGLDACDAGAVLNRFRLAPLAARSPWTLSRGERQRLLLAALEASDAPLLVLDEPAPGLDGEDVAELVRSIHSRTQRGGAVLMLSNRQDLAAAAHRRLRLTDAQLEHRP
ncbi:MAG: ATP-binding cassette domain-containing protein [Thermoanaerobaculaceae bacterium]|nr:ATP-binding cassette domain-containing protein [Thermoanaerobaculaceae bacterium]MDI9623249.1 ATP-binding cassette domain-containing protein [Acidobacteriota bacterium]NLH11286.1 ATP-binding cassette domain-containing protein [Holophagae bacterium]